MTSKLSAKFIELLRSLKSDAVPRPPRQSENVHNENGDSTDTQEEIFTEPNDKKKEKKPTFKKSFSMPNKESPEFEEEEDRRSSDASSVVNTQASGNVINIVNSKNIRCGNELIYYMAPVYGHHGHSKTSKTTYEDDDDEPVEKTNLIDLLFESNKKPEHEYLDYISKHLGKNWHSFFRKLGYKQGQIETVEIDMAKHGVAEARYQLLLDWIRNDGDGTLGKLSNVLWENGERQIVKELAAMYSKANGK